MRLYFITFLLLVLSFGNLNSQEGLKLILEMLMLEQKDFQQFFYLEKNILLEIGDDLLRGILKSQFYRPDLNIIINPFKNLFQKEHLASDIKALLILWLTEKIKESKCLQY
ncbi:MAG: hypothetical protein CM15mP102_13550 [Flavobacteriales bacterium]|nr:MAG: hypothetical protein CM15mP102_13550 [Flavobacteriales bacterium]